ncbi:MAG: hypothetical protein LKG19_03475 [Saprospiraceae bacterium]|nr:hypothetical protein [Saprospiraceae bacterium]
MQPFLQNETYTFIMTSKDKTTIDTREPVIYIERPEDIKNPIIPVFTKKGSEPVGFNVERYPKGMLENVFGK